MMANLVLWNNFEEHSWVKSGDDDGSLPPRQRGHKGHHNCVDVVERQETQLNDAFTLGKYQR